MKKLCSLILVFLFALTLAACNGSDDPAVGTGSSSGDGKVYNLTASFHSPDSNSSVIFAKQVCEQITEASDGRIQWTYHTGASLTNSGETFDHTMNGVCDLSWSTPSLVGARMKANTVMALPYLGVPQNADGGEIIWNLFESNDALQQEWEGVEVLCYYPMGATVLATSSKPIQTAADLNGLVLRTTEVTNSAFVTALGGGAASVPLSDVYENLEKNVVAGSLIDWNLYDSFHLYDVMKYAVDETLYGNAGTLIMNVDTYNSLPADLQAIVDEYTGLAGSRAGGQLTEEVDADMRQVCIDNGVDAQPASDQLKSEMQQAAQVSLQTFYDECSDAGVDGVALVEQMVAEMEALGYESPLFQE